MSDNIKTWLIIILTVPVWWFGMSQIWLWTVEVLCRELLRCTQ